MEYIELEYYGLLNSFISKELYKYYHTEEEREELEQELNLTFLQAVKLYNSKEDKPCKISTYLYSSFKITCKEYQTKQSKIKEKDEAIMNYKKREFDEETLSCYHSAKINLAEIEVERRDFDFRILSKDELELISFYYIGEKTYQQIAIIYKTTEAVIRQRKSRILKKLRIII